MNESKAWAMNGFIGFIMLLVSLALGIYSIVVQEAFWLGAILILIAVLLASSFTIVQPNNAVIVTFFGSYKGTIRDGGIWVTIPLSQRSHISLRVRNFNSAQLKVNDIAGNPIEIAAVFVFKVVDTAKARFDVEDYEKFVEIQSETALRHVANLYPYENYLDDRLSLRANADEVAAELTNELQERLAVSGVRVLEARLTHLAYSAEIAGAMLQRQQASAILAARQIIVQGAVGLVQMAILQLQNDGNVELDDERKAAMINNLMVAIVSDRSAHPIINTGSIY